MRTDGRAWVELNLENLEHNAVVLSSLLPNCCSLMPAVKANAYGHGAVFIAKKLSSLGINAFCVATVDEGIELRRGGIQGEILVLGYTFPSDFHLLAGYDLTQSVVDYEYAEEINSCGMKNKVHIAVDTGMHRIGIEWESIDEIKAVLAMKNLEVTGIFTHLCADDSLCTRDAKFTFLQGTRFRNVLASLGERAEGLKKHLLGSYGVINYPSLGGDYARVGIALYGVLSSRKDLKACPVKLREVLSLKARVTSVRILEEGESAGYGLDFTANGRTAIASLSVGYADGLPRALSSGKGRVLIGGKSYPIAGRICMDQTLVEVGANSDIHSGDIAVLIGDSGTEHISAYDLAEQSDTITNEVLSRLGSRLSRKVLD